MPVFVRGNRTTLCMHLHNLVENAINSFDFSSITTDEGMLSSAFVGYFVRLEVVSSDEQVIITVTDSGRPFEANLARYLRAMLSDALAVSKWDTTPFGKELMERIRALGSSEGSGQGLLRFAQYIRNLWDEIPPADAMELLQADDGTGKAVVIRLPRVETLQGVP